MDTSAILGFKQPDNTQQLSSLLGVAKGAQDLQNQGISLQERQAMQKVLSNPANYTDETGAFNLDKAQRAIMSAAPTTGAKYISDIATAHTKALDATKTLNALTSDNRAQIGGVLASIPPDATQDIVHKTVDALDKQFGGRLGPLVNVFKNGYAQALKAGGQKGASEYVMQSARSVLPQETQQSMNTPNGVTVNNGKTSEVVNVKPGVQGMPQGAAIPGTRTDMQVPPGGLESVETDAAGNKHIVTRTPSGAIVGTRPLGATGGAPPMFTLPPGETQETYRELQGQRTAAQQAANAAPVLHDINQTIVREASKGLNTGALGQLTQKLASATGYNMTAESATDYNLLGKMLERSALTAAQNMGPHTNAGLEAAVRANGSLDYTPTAIKKIAFLNDAIVSGQELYRDGLEKAVTTSPNSVFAKREFDSKWSKVATPQVLRLKNAVDNGNPEEIDSVLKEVGGKGSAGAKSLHKQLTELLQLSGR